MKVLIIHLTPKRNSVCVRVCALNSKRKEVAPFVLLWVLSRSLLLHFL